GAGPSPSSRLTVPAPTPLDKRTMSARQPRMATYEDILVETRDGVAWITINRPQVLNAFRAKTVDELIAAFRAAWHDTDVGVVVLTGAGERAFSAGGDQSERTEAGYGGAGGIGMDLHGLHRISRAIPKPVIAMVNGWAIGGGHVLHVLCDLTIAADSSRFGQVGPKVGSVDPGFGTAYLARVVGEKKAREMWYLCRQYTAQEALAMGLVNAVVPKAELRAETERWCRELLEKSPTALRLAKQSFNADTEHLTGISELGFSALALYYGTEEAMEARNAFLEKRPPPFRRGGAVQNVGSIASKSWVGSAPPGLTTTSRYFPPEQESLAAALMPRRNVPLNGRDRLNCGHVLPQTFGTLHSPC